jgi:hypothetical protein
MSKPLPASEIEKLLYQKPNWLPFSERVFDALRDGNMKEENVHVF